MAEQPESTDTFPPEIHDAVDGLMWLGHLEEEVEQWGHTFLIRTLKADEELQVSLIAKEFIDTFGQVKGMAMATIAAALVAVDGDEDFCPPIGPNKRDHVRAKFNYISQNWYWPVGEYLFGQYSRLVARQTEAIRAVEDLSSRSLRSSWPSVDSSIGAGDSKEASTDSNSDSSLISSPSKSE